VQKNICHTQNDLLKKACHVFFQLHSEPLTSCTHFVNDAFATFQFVKKHDQKRFEATRLLCSKNGRTSNHHDEFDISTSHLNDLTIIFKTLQLLEKF